MPRRFGCRDRPLARIQQLWAEVVVDQQEEECQPVLEECQLVEEVCQLEEVVVELEEEEVVLLDQPLVHKRTGEI